MHLNGKTEAQRRGRKPNSIVTKFRAQGWFKSVTVAADETSPSKLERMFHGRKVLTRMWDKYRDGKNLPSDRVSASDEDGIVLVVGDKYPQTQWFFQHSIWNAISCETMSLEALKEVLGKLDRSVTQHYQNLCSARATDSFDQLLQLAGQAIWIDRGDHYSALDHLAANLTMLRFDFIKFNECAHGGIAENIAKTLGPLSQSPWFEDCFEEFFDYLEKNIWLDIFDCMYHPDLIDGQGWRKTRVDWLLL